MLFRGPFIINAARMLVGRIRCRGDSFSFNYSYFIPPFASCCTRPFFGERSGRLPLMVCHSFPLESGTPRIESSSATCLDHLDFQRMSSDISLLGVGLGLSIEWAGVAKFSGPTVTTWSNSSHTIIFFKKKNKIITLCFHTYLTIYNT